MTPAQRAVYVALCREPTRELYSRPYLRRHGIRGPGSVDGAVRALLDLGELETISSGFSGSMVVTNARSRTSPRRAAGSVT